MDKVCKFCAKVIPEVATICPHCCIGQDLKIDHGIKLAIIAFIVAIVLMVGFVILPK